MTLDPVSLARLLWLPERWLGAWASSILGESKLAPVKDPGWAYKAITRPSECLVGHGCRR